MGRRYGKFGNDRALITEFVSCFAVFGEPAVSRPIGSHALEPLYARLPSRFPHLYEQLVLSYHWAEVDLGRLTLLANPPSLDLSGLQEAIFRDKGLIETLLPNGYLPFAKGPGGNYDPVCFDSTRRRKDGDSPVVQLDHEAILCHYRIRKVAELAPSFRALIIRIIADVRARA